jgi:hypothetical protein
MSNNNIEDSVYLTDNSIYGNKIKKVTPEGKESDVGISDVMYDNIIQSGINSTLDLSGINSLSQQATTRNEMYNIYDTMCEDGQISAVIKTYAEDATQRNAEGNIVWATSNDSNIAYLINYYIDSLNIDKNIYKWAYSLCKYGDLYIRLYRESEYDDAIFGKKNRNLTEDVKIKAFKKNDKYAHYVEMVTNPAEMFELTKFGKTVGFIKSPVDGVIVKSQNNIDFMNYAYKFKRNDITIYPPTEFVHAAIEDNVSRYEESVNIFLNDSDYDNDNNAYSYTVKRGQSLLSNVYKTWRELQLLEASVLLNRVTKSSIVRLINVEVGDMPKENVAKTLMGIKQMIEQKAAINKGSGMSEYTNPGPIENNVYVPTHDGVGAISTTQIGGDVDVKSLADLEWYLNKLYGSLQVPKNFFSQNDDAAGFNGGQSLTIISSRYAKTVKHIQNILTQLLKDIFNLILLDKGLDSYINNFEVHIQPPVTQEDIDRMENQSTKVQLSRDIMDMLSDIEDAPARLKILKSLMKNIVTDPDIIKELDEQIELAIGEKEPVEEPEQNNTDSDDDSEIFSLKDEDESSITNDSEDEDESSITNDSEDTEKSDNDMYTDINTEEGDTTEKSYDTILPSPDQLGIDLVNID